MVVSLSPAELVGLSSVLLLGLGHLTHLSSITCRMRTSPKSLDFADALMTTASWLIVVVCISSAFFPLQLNIGTFSILETSPRNSGCCPVVTICHEGSSRGQVQDMNWWDDEVHGWQNPTELFHHPWTSSNQSISWKQVTSWTPTTHSVPW